MFQLMLTYQRKGSTFYAFVHLSYFQRIFPALAGKVISKARNERECDLKTQVPTYLLFAGLVQGSVNYAPWAKLSPPSVFVNKVL